MAEEEENPYPVAPGASYIESKFPPWNVDRVVDEAVALTVDADPRFAVAGDESEDAAAYESVVVFERAPRGW